MSIMQICLVFSFVCDGCLKARGKKRKENKFSAKRLPQTKLGSYIENKVNNFLKSRDTGAGEVSIRVLSSSEKVVEIKSLMRSK